MTSNLGSEHILDGEDDLVMNEVKSHFKPEFINRIDEIVVFKKLSKENIEGILDKFIRDIETRLQDKQIKLELTSSAKSKLIEDGYDPVYGARPLKRLLSNTIEVLLSDAILTGKVKYNSTITIDYNNGNYHIKDSV